MNLLFNLRESQQKSLMLKKDENIWYCVPYDLSYDTKSKLAPESYTDNEQYLVVTDKRLIILSGDSIINEYLLKDCEEIKCENKVNCGIIVVKIQSVKYCVIRFSMRHLIRVSYVARGADLLARGVKEKITSSEYEPYCSTCGKALPGTSKCPHCDGKRVIFQKFWDLCRGYQWKLLAVSIVMVLASGISISIPNIQKNFIDNALRDGTGTMKDVVNFILTILGLTMFLIIINVTRNWWCVTLGARISMDLRSRLYQKIQILSLSFIQKRKPGELMNRISGDTIQIRRFMEDVFGNMISTLMTMIGALLFMFLMNWKMTLCTSALIVSVFIFAKLFWVHINKIFHMQWVRDDKMRSGLQDVLSGMRVVKAFGKEQEESDKFMEYSDAFARIQKKNEAFWAVFFPIMIFIMGLGSYVAIYFGGLDVLSDKMTVGELVQFVSYTGFLYGPIGWMTFLPRRFMQMIISLNRIYDVLDEVPQIADKHDSKDLELKGDIEFHNVNFGYNSYEPVLEGIDFSVKQGEMIGLVGASGTGKSTLINLIMRLYDVDSGSIRINGVDLRDIKQESLHSQLGVVLQETFLFSGTILNNLRFAKQDATYEEIIRAAKAANAHDFICKMADGYNTYVGEHGYTLSGGERQRIAIARAILNNPKLLILDEATSALDTESEYLIQQALDRLIQGKTTFAIAHRLSTLRNADRLVVIDGHGIAEIGTHNELLEKKGIYYGLVTAQLEMAKVV